jgi:hypothetical protein
MINMNFRILHLGNAPDEVEWVRLWGLMPLEKQDVFFLPGYFQAYKEENRGEAICVVATENDSIWMYPFLKCKILLFEDGSGRECYDIRTPYGYGGPIAVFSEENREFLEKAQNAFSKWCNDQKIVTEFCRFHPFIQNYECADLKMQVIKNRTTVAFDLKNYPTDVWVGTNYHNHRGMIRKANREGFTFHIENFQDRLSWFVEKYNETQKMLNAEEETFFSESYFQAFISKLENRVWLGVVRKNGKPVTAVVVLEGNFDAYLHLMAYFNDGPANGMVNFLYHEVALETAKRGLHRLQVGGGKTSNDDDSLFLFKARLSSLRHDFFIGKRVHNDQIYSELISKYKYINGESAYLQRKNLLQFYS